MIRANIHDVKTNFSKYLKKLPKEGVIVVCNRNTPVAEIRPVQATPKAPRPEGLGRGTVIIHKEFFDPLPDWLQDAFEGKS